MTYQEPQDPPTPENAPGRPTGGQSADPTISNTGAPFPAYPGTGHPPPPGSGRRTSPIAIGVIALVVGIGIGVGGFALVTDDADPEPGTGKPPVSRVPITTPTDWDTTTSGPAPAADGDYSMTSVSDACDLIDPTLLHRWGSTPRQPLEGWKNEPTDLACQASYTAPAADQTHYNEIGINFEARFTEAGADPAYDEWKDQDTGATGAGKASGEVTGIGAEGYWHTVVTDPEAGDSYGGGDYIVAVQDSNVSVRVRIAVLRQPGEPPVSWDEVSAMARSQVQRALDGLST